MDPYVQLGLSRQATPAEIRMRYLSLAHEHHPDRHRGSVGAVERMKSINQAHAALRTPEDRARTDARLDEEARHEASRVKAAQAPPAKPKAPETAQAVLNRVGRDWPLGVRVAATAAVSLAEAWLASRTSVPMPPRKKRRTTRKARPRRVNAPRI